MPLSAAEKALRAWASRLASVFGISQDDYQGIVRLQGGQCPICFKPVPDPASPAGQRRFPVDHNHKTGEVRGVPCEYCNRRRIAQWTDADMLRRLLSYIEDPPARRHFQGVRVVPGHGRRKRKRKARAKPVTY